MEDLYVIEQGCVVKKYDIQFLVTKNGIKIASIPVYNVDKILLFGNQQITTQAISMAFENGIDIFFLSQTGKLKGKVNSVNSKNIYIRFSQYEIWREKKRKICLAKEIVKGKIKNQDALLKRYEIKESKFVEIVEKINNADAIDTIMGYEGIASKIYFENFKKIIPETFDFNGRNRRPPKDEVNALLSLTYTMVMNNILYELEKSGFDPHIGFLHGIKYGRESLAMDVVEEFRQYFCDLFVIKLLNRKEIKKSDFFIKDGGYLLEETAFRKYIKKFNNELPQIRPTIKSQVDKLKKSIMEGDKYTPVILV